ncbi:olfactory receptor 50-like [Haliotis rubra]|uniref:olfactory receptor 50-like n=1 Tax=Haliotis rubra TaxID=36100 RepID=UPI001EE51912|nr:olfactory receptor 50-like [Haliotis rubra]
MANQTETISERGSNPALGAVYICLAITIMVTNVVIIVINVKSRHLQIPTLHILTGIAVFAFVTGLHLLMYDVPLLFSAQMTCNSTFTTAGTIMANLLQALNFFQATLAVLDRYVAVCHPLRYISIVTGRNILLAMFAYAGLCFVVVSFGLSLLHEMP